MYPLSRYVDYKRALFGLVLCLVINIYDINTPAIRKNNIPLSFRHLRTYFIHFKLYALRGMGPLQPINSQIVQKHLARA